MKKVALLRPVQTIDEEKGRRVAAARRLCAERLLRNRAFGDLGRDFRDPAWHIALDLYVAGSEQRTVSASSASIASGTPMTTGLRCLERMVRSGIVMRKDDPADARRSFVALTDEARRLMDIYLDGVA